MTQYKWLAEYEYSEWYLYRFEVERETPKTIYLTNVTPLHGWTYVSKQINKKRTNVFNTPQEAINHLLFELKYQKAIQEDSIRKINDGIPVLEKLLINLETGLPETGII
jgi:hypothetical protein